MLVLVTSGALSMLLGHHNGWHLLPRGDDILSNGVDEEGTLTHLQVKGPG